MLVYIYILIILSSGVRLWTSVSDLDNWHTSDFGFRLGFWTLDILWTPDFGFFRYRQTSYIRLPIVDFRHQFSDFGLWTSDILQTSDCSLHCQTSNFGLKEWSMVIAIMQTPSDRLRTVFRLMTDFRQTSDRRQTPTSDFGPRPDFEHQTSDFGLLTLNFTLQI